MPELYIAIVRYVRRMGFLSFVCGCFVRALLEGQEDQSILISGVSGAGKTETAKLLLGHLASVAGSEEGGVGSERIQHMVECTVVLESFGNAVMVRACRFYATMLLLSFSAHVRLFVLYVLHCVQNTLGGLNVYPRRRFFCLLLHGRIVYVH